MIYVKVCPKCGSTNIKNLIQNVGSFMSSGPFEAYQDHCLDCGNTGMFIEIEEKQLESFKKQLKRK